MILNNQNYIFTSDRENKENFLCRWVAFVENTQHILKTSEISSDATKKIYCSKLTTKMCNGKTFQLTVKLKSTLLYKALK